jgi:uncharacterized membrane protein YdjX (TVP38/TMEM64 family)
MLGLLSLLLVAVFTPLGSQLWVLLQHPNVERARLLLTANPLWVPLGVISMMVLHTLLPVPAEILAMAAGRTLGPFWGFWTVWIGAMLGAYLGFFLARLFGQPLLRRLVPPPRLERMQAWLQHVDIPLLLAVRLIPIISFNLVNYALGLTRISWWQFTWTTGVGIVPVTVFTVAFGAHLHDWRLLLLMTLAAVLVGLGSYALLRGRAGGLPGQPAADQEHPARKDA